MPIVAPPFFFIRQQVTSVLPHALQVCTNLFAAFLPMPSVLMLVEQVGHMCLTTVFIWSGCIPFMGLVTTVAYVSLHLGQDMTIVSPAWTCWRSSTFWSGLSSWAPLICCCPIVRLGSMARAATVAINSSFIFIILFCLLVATGLSRVLLFRFLIPRQSSTHAKDIQRVSMQSVRLRLMEIGRAACRERV